MEPRITKRERKLHLSYELPHRIHTAHIYPITAPNGSTVVIYGHARGLRLLWRGGRRRKQTTLARGNGDDHNSIEDVYEVEEEEQDPDCPFPGIIQHLDIELGSGDKPQGAMRVAIPTLNPTAVPVKLLQSTALVAVAFTDGSIAVLSIPLAPPIDEEKEQLLQEIAESTVKLQESGPIPADLSIKYVAAEHLPIITGPPDGVDGSLHIASVSRVLQIWSLEVTGDVILALSDNKLLRRAPLPAIGRKVRFHPSPRLSQVLVTDTSGAARIYDPYASTAPRRRPGSSDSMLSNPTTPAGTGKWVMAYLTPFHADEKHAHASAAFAQRKSILDARWALSGKAILVLLEDGEWGLWDIASASTGKRVEEFAIRGFLGTAGHTEAAEPASKRKGSSKLAPMTPNTRQAKAEQLFSGAPKIPGVAPQGGISISAHHNRTGPGDESAVLWYNSDIYSINSLQSFYQRSTSSSGGLGSLYSPGLTHITDVKLFSENITSISQFSSKSSSAGIGQMNTQRDLLISAEYRAIILQALRTTTPSRQLFQQQLAERQPVDRDQRMLDAGVLDIDGMDRMLDNMAGDAPAPTGRRVGFAAALG
ncbi:hypothetical protein CKM354_000202200 [Cercospora kikuchii]|uniref:Nucleoporin NUP37 n=1 Tax=Cercospora kikuchii TaxID=84275 RepID=A0A9P3FDJ1_9PEZI|nr:uncharacterized protein CKM354_000202200 [Cercospora kikuchii]GIZ38610.1 hypothetical protein CKM354_000202200 [Cercospora kikuchii]